MGWISKPEKERKVADMLKSIGLELEKFTLFNKPSSNYFWLVPEDTAVVIGATKKPRKARKNWADIMDKLYAVRNYSKHFGDLPTDNFLNTFDSFEGNTEGVALAKRFLEADVSMKGIWLHGPTGVGKSHLLTSILFDFIHKLGQEYYGGNREEKRP